MTKQEIDFFVLMGMIVGKEYKTFEEYEESEHYADLIKANLKEK